MNFIYKVVFNKQIGKFVVVSENAKSAGKSSKSKKSLVGVVAGVIAATAITFSTGAMAANQADDLTQATFIGDNNVATNSIKVDVIGDNNTVNRAGNLKIVGDTNIVNGNSAVENTTLIGSDNLLEESNDVLLIGNQNNVHQNSNSVIIANDSEIQGENHTVIGNNNDVSGDANTVQGNTNAVQGSALAVLGASNNVSGSELTVVGRANSVEGYVTQTLGAGNDVWANNSNIVGGNNYVSNQSWDYYSGEVVPSMGENINLLGERNGIIGEDLNIVGNGNATYNTDPNHIEINRYVDGGLLSDQFRNQSVYNSSVVGDGNRFGSNSQILGDENSIWGDSTSVVGQHNDVLGSYNRIFGSENNIGQTIEEFDESNEQWVITQKQSYSNTVLGNANSIYAEQNNILGSSNATQNLQNRMEMRAFDGVGSISDFYSGIVYNANVVGNENQYGSHTNLLGSTNGIFGGQNNAVGNHNEAFGYDNNVTGNDNRIGYANTNWFYDEENDAWHESFDIQEQYGTNVYGGMNSVQGNNASVVGNQNGVSGDYVNIHGIRNTPQNGSNGVEAPQLAAIDLNGMSLSEYYDFVASNSNLMGNENFYGAHTNILGNENSIYGAYNSAIGMQNHIYGEANNILGGNNLIGSFEDGYRYNPEAGWMEYTQTLTEGFENNVVGHTNVIVGDNTSVVGNNNTPMGMDLVRPDQPILNQPMLMAQNLDRPSLHKEPNESGEYEDNGSSNSAIVGNANGYGEMTGILGSYNTAFGYNNTVTGSLNEVRGEVNFVGGYANNLYGTDNIVLGVENALYNSERNTVIGRNNYVDYAELTLSESAPNIPEDIESELDLNPEQFMELYRVQQAMRAMQNNDGVYESHSNTLIGDDNTIVGTGNNVLGSMNSSAYSEANPSIVEESNIIGANNELEGIQLNVLGSMNSVTGGAILVNGTGNTAYGLMLNVNGLNNDVYAIDSNVSGSMNEIEGKTVYVNGSRNQVFAEKAIVSGAENIITTFTDEEIQNPTRTLTVSGFSNNLHKADESNLVGSYNTIAGGRNNVIGQENTIGTGIITGYDEVLEKPIFEIVESLENNVVGNGNYTIADKTSVMGDNNISARAVQLIEEHGENVAASNWQSELHNYARHAHELNSEGDLYRSAVVGYDNIYGAQSGVFGSFNETYGFNNNVVGNANYINGEANFVGGIENYVSGEILTVVGGGNDIGGIFNTAIGYHNDLQGGNANAIFGAMNTMTYSSSSNTVVGNYNVTGGYRNNIVGRDNINAEALFSEELQSGKGALYMRESLNLPSSVYDFFDDYYGNTTGSNVEVFGSENIYAGNYHLISGQGNLVKGDNHNVVGQHNEVQGENATVLGSGNIVESGYEEPKLKAANLSEFEAIYMPVVGNALVVGNNNHAGQGSIVIGSNSYGYDNGIAIGNFASAEYGNMALGHNVVATGETLGQDAFFVGGTADRELAVGSEEALTRITGVAAGSNDYDAINVQQLSAVVEDWNDRFNGVVMYDRDAETDEILTDRVTLAGVNGTTISNVADGVNDSDAVNLGQVNAELAVRDEKITINTDNIAANTRDIAANTRDIATNTADIASINETAVFFGRDENGAVDKSTLVLGSEGTLTQIQNVADATNANDAVNLGQVNAELAVRDEKITTNTDNIAVNTRDIASNTQNIATNTADISSINETGVFYGRDGAGAVDKSTLVLGSEGVLTQVKNVAWATDKTDAINLGQAESLVNGLDFGGIVRYDYDAETQAYVDNKITLTGENGTTITNVANAVNNSDAVNLGQVNTELALRDQKITTNTDNITVNTRDIAANTSDIADNTRDIEMNTQSIIINEREIAFNSRNIATNTADITSINETALFFGRDENGAVDRSVLLLGDGNTLTQIKNVANANTRTDAVNLGQVQDMFGGLDFGGIVRYDYDNDSQSYASNKITLASATTKEVVNIGGKLIEGTTDQYEGGTNVSVVTNGGTIISNVGTAKNADEAVNKGLLDSEIAKVVDQVGSIKGAIQYEISEEGDVDYGASVLRGDKAVMRSINVGGSLVEGTTDQYIGGVNVNVVANGGTKIKNLANATEVDEAVNLGQLNLAIAEINDTYGEATLGAVQYEISNGVVNYAKASLRGAMVAYNTDVNGVEVVSEGGTTVANVANATQADHAVNLGVLNSTIKPIDTNVKRNTTDINVINQSGVFFGAVNQNGSLAVDRSSLMLGSVDADGNVTALTQIKNVAKANTRTDAVNLGQVQDMFDELPTFESLAGVVKYDRNLDNSLNANSLTLAGSTAVIETNEDGVDVVVDGGTVIKNVGEAKAADHAVNKGLLDSQLALRDEKITTNSQNIATNSQNIAVNTSNIRNLQETGVFFNRVNGLVDTSVLNLAANGTRITNVANAQTRSDAVNLGQVLDLIGEVPEQVNLDGVVRYDKNADGTNNKDQITLAGQTAQQGKDKNGVDVVTSGGTTISNVANGLKADDAINKGQFDSALEDLKGSTVQYDRNEDGTVNNKKVTLGGAGGTVLTNVANGKIEVGSTDAVNGGQIAELIGSIEIPEQLVTQDAQTKEINVATNKDGKVVNVNGTQGDRVVAGVADGKISKTSNEAVTGKQLNQTNTAMATYLGGGAKWDEAKEEFTAPTYTVSSSKYHDVGGAIAALDARDNALDNKINDLEKNFGEKLDATNRYVRNVEKRVNAGVAASMAMEAAPYVAGKFTYAMGAANHGGEQAVGATFRRTAESGRWSLTTGFAKATEGDASVRIGISGVID